MLIRSDDNTLVEYPDELVAMMLASPFHGELGEADEWSIDELNCLIHGMLGTFFDESLSLAQNIAKIEESYAQLGSPSESNLAKARALVKFYNENLSEAEIGIADRATISAVFPFSSNNRLTPSGELIEQSNEAGSKLE